MERLYDRLSMEDLKHLKDLALEEHEAYFQRNPHHRQAYANALIGIALCQGAACHYLNPKVGIKDFDIWFFYVEDENVRLNPRAIKRIQNGYKGRPVDFLRRAIPKSIVQAYPHAPDQAITHYLLEQNTVTKKKLLEKGVIGLFPDHIFGKVLWKGEKCK